MRIAVDASVIIPILLSGDLGPLAPHELAAPPLIRSEAVSAIRELAYRGSIPHAEAREAIQRMGQLPIRLETPTGHHQRAFDIAVELGWAKTYDAEYVALAQALSIPLATIDDRLMRGVTRIVRTVRPTELSRA